MNPLIKLTEKTALLEFTQQYDINLKIEVNNYMLILQSMYHLGYKTISENIKDSFKNELNNLTKEQWMFYLEDINAIMTQLTKNNYKILLKDINK